MTRGSSISVFALHPLYLRVAAIPGLSSKLQSSIRLVTDRLNAGPPQDMDYEVRTHGRTAAPRAALITALACLLARVPPALASSRPQVVMHAKMDLAQSAFSEVGASTLSSPHFQAFLRDNRAWLPAYALFSVLRDKYETTDFATWGAYSRIDGVSSAVLPSPPALLLPLLLFAAFSTSADAGVCRWCLPLTRCTACRPPQATVAELTAPTSAMYPQVSFHFFLQYHLHCQLSEASACVPATAAPRAVPASRSSLLRRRSFAESQHVALKGDLPIGVARNGCALPTTALSLAAPASLEVPQLRRVAGAGAVQPRQADRRAARRLWCVRASLLASLPPWQYVHTLTLGPRLRALAADGQNWGFPTYNWERMAKDGFAWWQRRLHKLAEYFHACVRLPPRARAPPPRLTPRRSFRIDHILGFFRIWEIPSHAVSGLLGTSISGGRRTACLRRALILLAPARRHVPPRGAGVAARAGGGEHLGLQPPVRCVPPLPPHVLRPALTTGAQSPTCAGGR